MAYIVNKTNNDILAIIEDGTTNETASSITLIGKGRSNYGESLNENLVHIMEHFANISSPPNPIKGQLWYDITSTIKTLKIYKDPDWVAILDENFSSASISSGTTLPAAGNVFGDLFWNTADKTLHVWDVPGTWFQVFPESLPTFSKIQNPGNTTYVDTEFALDQVTIRANGSDVVLVSDAQTQINNDLILQNNLVVDGVGVYKKQQYFDASQSSATLADAATINWNLDVAQVATVTLGGNRTLANPTNMKKGAVYILIVKQDGTGNRALTYGTAYKFIAGNDPVLTSDPNAVDILSFISDGTSMFGSAVLDFK